VTGKHRRNRTRKAFPWPVLVFAGILLILAAFLLANESAQGNAAPSSAGSGGPAIAVEPQKIDYGHVKFGTNETFKIKVTNTGGAALSFEGAPYIEVLEGC
jgi:hypothetical protein